MLFDLVPRKTAAESESSYQEAICLACDQIVRLYELASLSANPLAFVRNLHDELTRIFESNDVGIFLLDSSGDFLTECSTLTMFGLLPNEELTQIPRSMGRIDMIIKDLVPVVTDCEKPNKSDFVPPDLQTEGCRQILSFPIVSGEIAIGLVSVKYREPRDWNAYNLRIASAIGRVVGTSMGVGSDWFERQRYGYENTGELQQRYFLSDASRSKLRGILATSKRLSVRERQIMKLVAEGASNDEIAERLYISVSTVKKIVASLMNKLGASNRTQIAVHATKLQMIESGDAQ